MYHPTDKSYRQARAIKTGKHKLHPVHQQLIDAVSKQFNVKALDFYCYTKETSAGYKQQAVCIIVETKAECQIFDTPSNYAQLIRMFMPYLLSDDKVVKRIDPLKRDVFPATLKPFPEVIAGFHALEDIEAIIARTKAAEAIKTIGNDYPVQIWSVTLYNDNQNTIIFYFTDRQKTENESNGFNDIIRKRVLEELKKYDDFGFFGTHSLSLYFDSKESFDRDYQSNWHYYFQ